MRVEYMLIPISRNTSRQRREAVREKWSNAKIIQDDFEQLKLNLNYDEKQNFWVCCDPVMYKDIEEDFQEIENVKKQLKIEKLKENPNNTATTWIYRVPSIEYSKQRITYEGQSEPQ